MPDILSVLNHEVQLHVEFSTDQLWIDKKNLTQSFLNQYGGKLGT